MLPWRIVCMCFHITLSIGSCSPLFGSRLLLIAASILVMVSCLGEVSGFPQRDEPLPDQAQVQQHTDGRPVEGPGRGQRETCRHNDGHLDLTERLPCAQGNHILIHCLCLLVSAQCLYS